MTDKSALHARFRACLDAYGADLSRWPQADAKAAAELLAGSPSARRQLAEAAALDRVLANAPAPSAARRTAIADAIMASVARIEPAATVAQASANVIPLRPRRPAEPSRSATPPMPRRQLWQVAAGLAASLVTGVMIGMFDIAPQSMANALFAGGSDLEVAQLVDTVSGDTLTSPLDEDQ